MHVPKTAQEAAARGNLIEAIKLVREATGVGLREAKDAVDALSGSPTPGLPVARTGLAPGEVPRRTWPLLRFIVNCCLLAVAALLFVAACER